MIFCWAIWWDQNQVKSVEVLSVEWVIRGTWREDDLCWDYSWHWDNCDEHKNWADWEGAVVLSHDLATNARSTAIPPPPPPPPPPHTNHKYEEIPGLTKKLYSSQSQHSSVLVAFRLWRGMRFVLCLNQQFGKRKIQHRMFCFVFVARLIYHLIINDWFIHSFISPSLFIPFSSSHL